MSGEREDCGCYGIFLTKTIGDKTYCIDCYDKLILQSQNTELKEKLDKCELLIDAIYNVDTKDPSNPLVDIGDLYTDIMTLIETHRRQALKEVSND